MIRLIEEFKLYDLGVSEVAEGWTSLEWELYSEWRHEHEYDAEGLCVECGLDGNA